MRSHSDNEKGGAPTGAPPFLVVAEKRLAMVTAALHLGSSTVYLHLWIWMLPPASFPLAW